MGRLKKKRNKKIKSSQKTKSFDSLLLSTKQLMILGGLLMIVFIAYMPILQGEFINYDDDIYITENPMIVNLNLESFKSLFGNYYKNQYSPVAMLIMALEYKVFGGSVGALKFVSIIWHVIGFLLVFQLVRKLFNRFDYAIITAGLFGVQTLHVESVAWLTASMKIGSFAVFSLVSLLLYVRYLEKKSKVLFISSLVFFLLACFSKEQAITLTGIILSIDYLKNRSLLSQEVILEKIPFAVISLIFVLVTLGITPEMQNESMVGYFSALERLLFICHSIVLYFLKIIFPFNLSTFYTYPIKSEIPSIYYLSPFIVSGLIYGMYYSFKKGNRLIVFGLLFFFINISLNFASQLMAVRDTMIADRYMYLPSIGIFMIFAHFILNQIKQKPKLKTAVWGCLLIYGVLITCLTYQRCSVWNDSISVFTDAIEKGVQDKNKINPFMALAYNNRGVGYKRKNKFDEAMTDYDKAIQSNKEYEDAYLNRGNLYFIQGQHDKALIDLNEAIDLDPEYAKAFNSRGSVYATQGRLEASLIEFNEAIRLDPAYKDAYKNRGFAYFNLKNYQQALTDLNKFLSYEPNHTNVNNVKQAIIKELNK